MSLSRDHVGLGNSSDDMFGKGLFPPLEIGELLGSSFHGSLVGWVALWPSGFSVFEEQGQEGEGGHPSPQTPGHTERPVGMQGSSAGGGLGAGLAGHGLTGLQLPPQRHLLPSLQVHFSPFLRNVLICGQTGTLCVCV